MKKEVEIPKGRTQTVSVKFTETEYGRLMDIVSERTEKAGIQTDLSKVIRGILFSEKAEQDSRAETIRLLRKIRTDLHQSAQHVARSGSRNELREYMVSLQALQDLLQSIDGKWQVSGAQDAQKDLLLVIHDKLDRILSKLEEA